MARVRISNIAPEIQEQYHIGESIDVTADAEGNGINFTFINNDGEEIILFAIERFGSEINYMIL